MNTITKPFEYGVKAVFYVFAALLPVWFFPYTLPVEFGREVTFGVLITLAVILYLLWILRSGEVVLLHSPILYAAGAVLAVFAASAFFSKSMLVSFFFADPVAERWMTLLLAVLLMFVAGHGFWSGKNIKTLLLVLIVSSTISALAAFLQFMGVPTFSLLSSIAAANDFNLVGTANTLALFYAIMLLVTLGVLTFNSEGMRRRESALLILASVLFLANLLAVNFRTSWIVLLGAGIFLFGLVLERSRRGGKKEFGPQYWAAFGVIVLSVVMLMVRTPLIPSLRLPLEVNSSFAGTLSIAQGVFKEGSKQIFLGSGLGTFGLDWAKYKDPSVNRPMIINGQAVDFSGLRFNQGYSYFATLVPTAGILGALSFLVFLFSILFVYLRRILVMEEEKEMFAPALFLGLVGLALVLFLHPANLTLTLLFFFLAGLPMSQLALVSAGFKETGSPSGDPVSTAFGSGKSFWDIKGLVLKLTNPWPLFLSSLIAIILVSVSVAFLYQEIARVRSMMAWVAGNRAFSRGDLQGAESNFQRAIILEEENPRNQHTLVLLELEKVRNLIQRAAGGENVQQEFQAAVASGIQSAQRLLALFPQEPIFWRTQGALYETVIPFIPGAERLAADSYRRAGELDPYNPAIWADLGRSYLVFGERVQFLINQGNQQPELPQIRGTALAEAEKAFQKAIEVKPDFAQAHFLLAQTAVRLNKIQDAIRSVENARQSAPLDIGIAFQLGLLYYQTNDMNRAEAEFLRTVSLSENYSNARYFLGLIYDRRGEKQKAIEEFEKIKAFNPDNQEVQKILGNLRSNRPALDGIAPPPPEQRKEAPVSEGQQR